MGLAIQSDGKIVVVGGTGQNAELPGGEWIVVRYAVGQQMSGDFDGDGKTDIAVYGYGRLAAAESSGGFINQAFGGPADQFVAGDFDGDGKTDIAVYGYGRLAVLKSSGGFINQPFGGPADQFVAGDFDGDGKTDIAVYGYGRLAVLESAAGS